MSTTLATQRALLVTDLADASSVTFDTGDLNGAIQDAYNEVVAKTQCIVKKTTLNWATNTQGNYFDFLTTYGVTDYMATIAIFNNVTNQFLRDDVSYRDLTRIRVDWELWRGTSQFWVPHSLKYSLIVPIPTAASGTFDLWYYAFAPTLSTDGTALDIADDLSIIEEYSMMDLLRSVEEFTKAETWEVEYREELIAYKTRCHNLAKYNLLLRI